MKKLYVNPFIEIQEITVEEMILASGVEFGEEDPNEVVDAWPW